MAEVRKSYAFMLPWSIDHPGGVNQVVKNLLEEFRVAGEYHPILIENHWDYARPDIQDRPDYTHIRLRLRGPLGNSHHLKTLVAFLLSLPFTLRTLGRLITEYRIEAFNAHFPGLGTLPIALLRFVGRYRGALILSFHGLDLHSAGNSGRVGRALWRFLLRCATAIVACSRHFATEVSEFADKMAGRVHAVQNGLNIDYFLRNVDRSTRLPAALRDRRFILSVATFEQKKGLDVLVQAFVEVRRAYSGLALVLVGRSSEAGPNLRALASELKIAEDVFFVESVPHQQVGLFLERANVFCLPSRVEPFGIAILEAGAYRLPVVASRVGGIPEIVDDGDTGLLVVPDDVKALIPALDRVLSDTEFARGLGERLHRRVAADFSWKRAYEGYRALLPAS
ncbi:MAG: glycosyltransferase family 4 protein [Gammaproteobacteria bacterium]